MPPNDNTNLQAQIEKMSKDIEALNNAVFKNNFSARQDFNKASKFTTKLIIPHYPSVPITGEVGEILEVGGKVYVCSTTNVFTVVGTQT